MSTKEQQVQEMTNKIASFISYMAKVLPDDVQEKIHELAQDEKNPMAKSIYETMQHNMDLAAQLNRPSCQDTGVLQFWVKVGSNYPLLGELEDILREATYKATQEAPLRLKPGEGYEGVAKFVLDLMTSYGLNACPPLLVGVGIATTIDTAAGLSKKALMRPVSSKAPNEKAAYMEQLLEDGINKIGIGPQGMGGDKTVLGVNIEHGTRHPSVISCAVSVGCWNHRRGDLVFDKDGNCTVKSHKGVTL